MLNALPAKKPARNRLTARPPSANARPINLAANAPICAAISPLNAPPALTVTAIFALPHAMAKPARVPRCGVMPPVAPARKVTALPPKARAAHRNRRCVVTVTALPVALRVKAIASASSLAVLVMVKSGLARKCAGMVSPRKALPAMDNAHRWHLAMASVHRWKVVTASVLKAMRHVMVSVHLDKALPVTVKVLLPSRRCVMADSVPRKADGNLKASARHNAAPRVIVPKVNAVKVKAVRNARPSSENNLFKSL